MYRKLLGAIALGILLAGLFAVLPAAANPPAPEDGVVTGKTTELTAQPRSKGVKPIDQPNPKDYLRLRARQRLMEAGLSAQAAALETTATDRVLVILVEFAGTDTFTWYAPTDPNDPSTGSQWDPYGIADPNEFTGIVGDCSRIITQTKTFTYTGPLHNQIPRPLSAADRSGDTIWTPDFAKKWFEDFMFGNGVVFDYTRQDGSRVYEDFTGKSVKKYYEDLSGGKYTFNGDVIGWVQVPHSTWYYDADQCPGARSGASVRRGGMIPGAGNARTLVKDALDAVNAISNTIPGFNWANYDTDGDGIIDRLWIVHAGYGEEDGTVLLNRTDYGEASVWSHSSAVTPPYQVAPGIAAGPYIIMPENGGIGVFAHEYGHNLGADDLYAYGEGETSAGFWTLMADDWTGYPIGFQPPAVDPWHLDRWGWLDPLVVTDPTQEYVVKIGQPTNFPGGEGVYRGVKIPLPTGYVPLAVQPIGNFQWWGGKADLINSMMTTKNPIAIPAAGATLEFNLAYGIETEWDFLWIQASTDGGSTWQTLTNAHTSCQHDPSWIGGLYGFPDDLCGAGLGGFTDYNAEFPHYGTETFDLTGFAGQSILLRFWYMTDWATTYEGPFVDNVKITSGDTILFFDDAESGDANWIYADEWGRNNGTKSFTHNYYLQWRNVNPNGGYDSALGESRWRFGPANTGLLVWYNNNAYTDNEIFNYLTDFPAFGPKGRMLVVDSHPEPYRDPDYVTNYPNEGANIAHRGLMRDAPFTLQDTVPFTHTDPYRPGAKQHSYPGRPAVSVFDDRFGYYPGAEFAVRSPYQGPGWMTKQWDASVVIPSKAFYGIKAPGYTGNQRLRFGCSIATSGSFKDYLLCYSFAGLGYDGGTGNPIDADLSAPYGWRVELIEEAPDHTWGKVRIYHRDTKRTAIISAAEDVGYFDSRQILMNFLNVGFLWAGIDSRPQTPRILHGGVQFSLSDALPANAHIVSASLELMGRSDQYLDRRVPGAWTADLMPASLDSVWAKSNYYQLHYTNPVATLTPVLDNNALRSGQVNTFVLDAAGVAELQSRLGTTGKASFRLSGTTPAPYARLVFGWDGRSNATPVLQVVYEVP